jgi:hypothetical protein
MYDNRQVILGGNPTTTIEPYRIVAHGTNAGEIKRAGAGDAPIGISSDRAAAATDDRADYVAMGPHKARVGAAAVSAGVWLKPDANGAGVAAAATDVAICRTINAAAAGEVVDVLVMPYKV